MIKKTGINSPFSLSEGLITKIRLLVADMSANGGWGRGRVNQNIKILVLLQNYDMHLEIVAKNTYIFCKSVRQNLKPQLKFFFIDAFPKNVI